VAVNLYCVVCNELIETGGFGVFLALPAERVGHVRPPAYLVHEECARRVAHPDFDFTSSAFGRSGWPEKGDPD
jgi:hypothetical protein